MRSRWLDYAAHTPDHGMTMWGDSGIRSDVEPWARALALRYAMQGLVVTRLTWQATRRKGA